MVSVPGHSVALVVHTESWHHLFAEEAKILWRAIGEYVLEIEHIGSTAICGVSAKPVIDIAAAVVGPVQAGRCIDPLTNLGYTYRGEYGIRGRLYFVKGYPRTHHLHLLNVQSVEWASHLAFRDALRRDGGLAQEYDRLKRGLAERYRADKAPYTAGKAPFIQAVLKRALEV